MREIYKIVKMRKEEVVFRCKLDDIPIDIYSLRFGFSAYRFPNETALAAEWRRRIGNEVSTGIKSFCDGRFLFIVEKFDSNVFSTLAECERKAC